LQINQLLCVMAHLFNYGTDHLTVDITLSIANGTTKGVLGRDAIAAITRSRQSVEEIVDQNRTVYGVNTGFGILANTAISPEDTATLQHKIIQSHSVGVGNPIPEEIARIMMITKLHSLAKGYSGVQLATLERIIWHIENNITPVVPEKGSVGASGDLAPLAHLFLPLLGLGEVFVNGERKPSSEILKKHGLSPIALGPKEGLALINGTQFILAYAVK